MPHSEHSTYLSLWAVGKEEVGHHIPYQEDDQDEESQRASLHDRRKKTLLTMKITTSGKKKQRLSANGKETWEEREMQEDVLGLISTNQEHCKMWKHPCK